MCGSQPTHLISYTAWLSFPIVRRPIIYPGVLARKLQFQLDHLIQFVAQCETLAFFDGEALPVGLLSIFCSIIIVKNHKGQVSSDVSDLSVIVHQRTVYYEKST